MNKAFRSVKSIRDMLQQAGIRPTAQRLAICRFVFSEADHPTADQVKHHLDGVFPMISTATIYNTLNTLVERGLLRAIKFPHADAVVYDPNMYHHYHFLDEASGRLFDIDPQQVDVRPHLGDQCEITEVDVLIRGRMNRAPR